MNHKASTLDAICFSLVFSLGLGAHTRRSAAPAQENQENKAVLNPFGSYHNYP